MIRVRDSGGLAVIGAVRVRDSGGLNTLSQFSIRDAGGLHALLTAFSVTASPANVSGYGSSPGSIQVVTDYSTATVSGGVPPYSYLWEPDDPTWSAVNPTISSTPFRSPLLGAGDISSASFICTVTDSNGTEIESNAVVAFANNVGGL